MLWFDPITRAQRRQLLRRLPLADERLRRHAVDRHRDRQQRDRRPRSPGAAQPAPHADGDQHGVLSDADVELALPRALRRPVRQQRRLPVSRARRGGRSRTCRTCSRRRRSSRPPSASRWRGSHFPGDNDDIRAEVLRRLNANRELPPTVRRECSPTVRAGAPITFDHFGRAIAEFEFTLVFADAPIDRYARGERHALSEGQKRGAVLFFGRAGCVPCHAVSRARPTRCSATSAST